MPVVGFIRDGTADASARYVAAFHKGLSEIGVVEGQNVTVEYHWLDGRYDRLPSLIADFVSRPVAVIATTGPTAAAQAAKAATAKIPIVFTSGLDPVQLGLVASFNRPGGNATGVSLFTTELGPKRLGLVRELLPQPGAIAFFVNPNTTATPFQVTEMQAAAQAVGQPLLIFNAGTEEQGLDVLVMTHACRATRPILLLLIG